ncbi:MAG: crosslink repair DNA glycosylase YcaQ family protein [Pseudomonadales bacterium]
MVLERQGLLKREPFGRGKAATLRAIEQLGYVQIDTISVVARAHHHVLRTRVSNYQPEHLERLQREGRIFEYWYHAAAYLPITDYRFALPKMQRMAAKADRWVRSRNTGLLQDVLARIREEGALKARDFDAPDHSGGGWWNWKPAKGALEQLFMQGDLMAVGRDGFEKIYDLTERVLPADVDTGAPSEREFVAHLLDATLRTQGFATSPAVLYLRPGASLRTTLQQILEERVADSILVPVRLPDGSPAFAEPELLERRAPVSSNRVSILSPFDNLVIQRKRTRTVFGFDYQVECYVPEHKRRYGYFCLPILYRDRLVGRLDCKAHRPEARLEIRDLFIEDDALRVRAPAEFLAALQDGLDRFAHDNGCAPPALPAKARWRAA